MKKLLLSLISLLLLANTAQAQQLAFPGAEGYGRYTTGGRGGEVCYVTRNDDCSDDNLIEGTLRWAIRHDNGGLPRTILFATSGVIFLTSKLNLAYDNVSILGQSAPGGGICLAGYKLYICKDNVIVRYVRFRAGDAIDTNMTSVDIENAHHVIIDHCSMTWSMEECMTAYDTDSTTVQYCIIGEGLYNSKHDKGARAYAMQWGGEHSTLHHCLVTNSVNRTPLFNGVRSNSNNRGDHDYQVDSEFANNVIFNFGKKNSSHGGANYGQNGKVHTLDGYGEPYDHLLVVNNYYKPGPATETGAYMLYADTAGGDYWMSGNYAENTLVTVTPFGFAGSYQSKQDTAIVMSGMAYESAQTAYSTTLANCGARLPRLDEVDTRLVAEASGSIQPVAKASYGKLGIIDSPADILLEHPMAYAVDGIVYTDYPDIQAGATDKYILDVDGNGVPDQLVGVSLEDYMNGLVDGTYTKSDYETEDVFAQTGWEIFTLPTAEPTKDSDEEYSYTFYGYEVCGRVYSAGASVYAPAGTSVTPVYTREVLPWGESHTTATGEDVITWTLDGPYEDDLAPISRYNDIWDADVTKATVGSHVSETYSTNTKNKGATCAVFQPTAKSSSLDSEAYVRFTIQPRDGLTFAIDSVTFRALMNAGSCSLNAAYQFGEEDEDSFANGKINSTNAVYTDYSKLFTNPIASADPFTLKVYFYATDVSKGMGIRDVKIYLHWNDESKTEPKPEGLLQNSSSIPTHKIIRNGHILIRRGDALYNLTGTRL